MSLPELLEKRLPTAGEEQTAEEGLLRRAACGRAHGGARGGGRGGGRGVGRRAHDPFEDADQQVRVLGCGAVLESAERERAGELLAVREERRRLVWPRGRLA